jgi:hypothetical protein
MQYFFALSAYMFLLTTVFGRRDNPTSLKRCPRVVVISYTMLHRLRKSMLEQEWAFLIVDESHHVRCSKKASESEEVQIVTYISLYRKFIGGFVLFFLPVKEKINDNDALIRGGVIISLFTSHISAHDHIVV